MTFFQAMIIAIIEGLTEFLPISSTGHMAIASAFMGIGDDHFVKLFEVVIQFAAILAVVVLYYKKFFDFKNLQFFLKIGIAIIPTLVFGALLYSKIKELIAKPIVIAVVLILGGVVLLFVDKWFNKPSMHDEKEVSWLCSLKVGFFQILSMVLPGLSRSGATIIGGMSLGLSRKLAAEFSFFLAVPTMLAASIKDLYETYKDHPEVMTTDNFKLLGLGSLVSFVVAVLAIKFFIGFLQKHGFKLFGVYRIIVGVIVLLLLLSGASLNVA